ncbi:MAG: universal stress protein [Corynebacterium camporealensis]|uniref:universal stress protein n=1 Tax=Corynebacterium camporealensis TaxID=161896 RepID=UPI002A91C922|nr:universal stress protein [Corynebacterium camporealensis]MDY5839166.1 universal stress protein [Corynebacterium camporealensis]
MAKDSSSSQLNGDNDRPVRLLVCWSPQSTGTEVLEFAAWLHKTQPVQVRVASTLYQPWATTSLSKLGGKYKKWYKKEKEATAKRVRHELHEHGIPESAWDEEPSVLVDGPNRPTLLTGVAQDYDADLIVLGPNQAAPKGRFFAGSTADALLHYSPIPLALIPRGIKLSKNGIKRVNFIINERDEEVEPGLTIAGKLALRWDTPLRLLVFSPDGLMAPTLNDDIDVTKKLTRDWREHSLARMDRACDLLQKEVGDVDVSAEVGTGNGWGGAIDSLKWKKGDIACMSSSAQGPIERVFLGSRATEMLPHLGVPILVRPFGR